MQANLCFLAPQVITKSFAVEMFTACMPLMAGSGYILQCSYRGRGYVPPTSVWPGRGNCRKPRRKNGGGLRVPDHLGQTL